MKKILFVIDTVEIGGATKLTFDVIDSLDRGKFSCEILFLNATRFGADDLIKFFDFNNNTRLLRFDKFNALRRIIFMYRNFRKYDLVHSCMEQSNIYSSFVKNLPFSGFKLAITYHGLDSSYIVDPSALKLQEPGIIRRFIMKQFQNTLYKNVDLFIAVCESIKSYLITCRHISESKIKLIYHGLNLHYQNDLISKIITSGPKRKKKEDTFTIGYLGRLGYSKGLEGMFEILPKVRELIPNLNVIIKGDGELKDYLTGKSAELSLNEFVKFENFGRDVADFYRKIDLMVLPSYYETTNLTVLEAMYSGTLVLCSDAGGLPEIIINNENGFMFKTGDFGNLTERIFEISGLRSDELEIIKRKAYDTVITKFDFNRNSKVIAKTFEELIGSKSNSE